MLALLKKDQLTARKNKAVVKTKLLTTLISDAVMIGKNDGNREPTESEIVALIKKYIKNTEETLKHTDNIEVVEELAILESYLPTQLTDGQLETIIKDQIRLNKYDSPKQMGLIMKFLKEKHDGQFDGRAASEIAKGLLS